jgi:hypothetical protein
MILVATEFGRPVVAPPRVPADKVKSRLSRILC